MNSSKQPITPFFCINVTKGKEAPNIDIEEAFVSASISAQTKQNFENKQASFEQSVKKGNLPLWLKIIQLACAFVFFVGSLGIIKAGFNVGFDTAFRNAPVLIIICILCGIVWAVLHFLSKAKAKKTFEEEHIEEKADDIINDVKDIFKELNVPDDAINVDVLMFGYKIKNGEICPHTSASQMTPFTNLSFKAYITGDKLNLADIENVYSFNISDFVAITTVNKQICVHEWYKDLPPTDKAYSSFNIKVNDRYELIYFKPYHILEFKHNGEKFGIYFPCYEIDTVERLTGLKAEKITKY